MKTVKIIAFLLIFAAGWIIRGPSGAFAQTTTLTYSVFFPPTHGQSLAASEWAREIERLTGGRVKIKSRDLCTTPL